MSRLRKIRRQQERLNAPSVSVTNVASFAEKFKAFEGELKGLVELDKIIREAHQSVSLLLKYQELLEEELDIQREVTLRLMAEAGTISVEELREVERRVRDELQSQTDPL